MDAYQVAAAHACKIELRIEHYVVDDAGVSRNKSATYTRWDKILDALK